MIDKILIFTNLTVRHLIKNYSQVNILFDRNSYLSTLRFSLKKCRVWKIQ